MAGRGGRDFLFHLPSTTDEDKSRGRLGVQRSWERLLTDCWCTLHGSDDGNLRPVDVHPVIIVSVHLPLVLNLRRSRILDGSGVAVNWVGPGAGELVL